MGNENRKIYHEKYLNILFLRDCCAALGTAPLKQQFSKS
jgi:hypothetical protein